VAPVYSNQLWPAGGHLANCLIPTQLRASRILDIGCGSELYFLAHTAFREKFAVDQWLLPSADHLVQD
jgi:hypothetical protein